MSVKNSLLKMSVLASLAVGVIAPAISFADEKKGEAKPENSAPENKAPEAKAEAKEKKVAGPKMWGIWRKFTSLTPEQKVKMAEIHEKALAEKRKIEDQEEADLLAQLTDEQKVELQALKESDAAKKKAKDADKKKDEPAEKPKGE